MDSKLIGGFIAELRKEKGLTQAAIAEQLNISNRTVSKWENGDGYPDITTIPKLAEILGVTADELLSGKRSEKAHNDEEVKPKHVYFDLIYTETKKGWREAFHAFGVKKTPFWLVMLIGFFCDYTMFIKYMTMEHSGNGIATMLKIYVIITSIILFGLLLVNEFAPLAYIRGVKDMNKGVKPPTHTVFSDKIYLSEGVVAQEFDYSSFTEFKICKNIYILRINKRGVLYIPKSVLGDNAAEFEAFMTERIPTVTHYKTRPKHRIIAAVLIVIALAQTGIGIAHVTNKTEKLYYHDIDTKLYYYLDNEKAFDFGLKNVTEDEELMKEAEREGDAIYYAEDYLPLEKISDVEVTKYAVIFNSTFSTEYYNGYIHYEGESNPLPYQIGFRKTGVDDYKQNYIAEDDLYLYGRENNETPTSTPWYLVKPVGENWYYYEYHSDEQ